MAVCGYILLYAYKTGFATIFSHTNGLCVLTIVKSFSVCALPVVPEAHSYVKQVVEQERELAAIQKIGADSVALPYRIQMGQSKVKRMIIQLSAIDTPRKDTLVRLLKDLNSKVLESIDDMQISQSKTDTLVNNVILTNSWAQDQLKMIEARHVSIMAPLYAIGNRIGKGGKDQTTEKSVQAAFIAHSNKLADKAEVVVTSYQKSFKSLTELQDFLDLLATEFKHEEKAVGNKRKTEESYWRIVLASYRDKMSNFDEAVSLCTEFSRELAKASSITQTVLSKIMQIRSKVIELQDELSGAAEGSLISGQVSSLQLTIDKLGASVEYLEARKLASKAEQRRRIAAMKKEMEKHMDRV